MNRYGPYRSTSTRLATWDYARGGWYFVTICTEDRRPSLAPSGLPGCRCAGDIAFGHIRQIPIRFRSVKLAAGVVMPDHVHLLLGLPDVGADGETFEPRQFGPPASGALSTWINLFKGIVTRDIRREADPSFAWQPGFHDRIVRDEEEFIAKIDYIGENAVRAELVAHPEDWPYVVRGNHHP